MAESSLCIYLRCTKSLRMSTLLLLERARSAWLSSWNCIIREKQESYLIVMVRDRNHFIAFLF